MLTTVERAGASTTIVSRRTTLGALPRPLDVTFPGSVYGWSPISTTTVAAVLHLDKGLWGTWRNRGLLPRPLPAEWFRSASGKPLTYLVTDVLTWLAHRHGEPLDALDVWRTNLVRDLDTETADPEGVRTWAQIYARAAGRTVGDVTFTAAGHAAYLESLSAM